LLHKGVLKSGTISLGNNFPVAKLPILDLFDMKSIRRRTVRYWKKVVFGGVQVLDFVVAARLDYYFTKLSDAP
jgi:hypothetical protein